MDGQTQIWIVVFTSVMVDKMKSNLNISVNQKIGLLVPYIKKRITAQIKSIALIVIYLICFQTIVLNIAISEAAILATGISVVILGLAFFMEGLFLGLMPLGEVIGVKLPQKTKLPTTLTFAFILGIGATFAEPAIGILKAAGTYVKAWDAPLLFMFLNKYSNYLVYSVAVGVGFAVFFGMLRFLYGWSLKPFIYIVVGILSAFSFWAIFEPNMKFLTGLAWDCGAVTTGPVTVPLVLALGIGICRIVSGGTSESAGLGVVTLASLFPILAVLSLGAFFLDRVPPPMKETQFFSKENQSKILNMFNDRNEMIGYALQNAQPDSQVALFDGSHEKMIEFIQNNYPESLPKARVLLEKEKSLIGIYLTAHPLDDYRLELRNFCSRDVTLTDINNDIENEKIKKLQRRIAGLSEQAEKVFIQSIWGLVQALEAKDPYSKKHSENVMYYAVGIAKTMKIAPEQIDVILRAAMIHDIGKIGIPDAILTKPAKLTPRERSIIEQHPLIAVRILEKMTFLEQEIAIIRHHHEKWNGHGYPDGLSNSAIPLGARIMAIADTFDALTSNRTYHDARSITEAIKILVDSSGYDYAPKVVEGMVSWVQNTRSQMGQTQLTTKGLLESQRQQDKSSLTQLIACEVAL